MFNIVVNGIKGHPEKRQINIEIFRRYMLNMSNTEFVRYIRNVRVDSLRLVLICLKMQISEF